MKQTSVSLSNRTVQRFLVNEGLCYMNTQRKIQLTIDQKAARLEMCRTWLVEGVSSKNLVFTDESRYNLDGPD